MLATAPQTWPWNYDRVSFPLLLHEQLHRALEPSMTEDIRREGKWGTKSLMVEIQMVHFR